MAVYRNADYQTRVWPSIQRPNGRTLELEPGEEVELDLPDDFVDRHLLAGQARRTRPKKTASPDVTETTTEQDGDGAAPTEDQGDAGSSDVAVETPQES